MPSQIYIQGAIEEVLAVSTYVMEEDTVQPLDEVQINKVQQAANAMASKVRPSLAEVVLSTSTHVTFSFIGSCIPAAYLQSAMKCLTVLQCSDLYVRCNSSGCWLQGLRVLGVATRSLDHGRVTVNAGDECLMVFWGFLTLRDEVKASAGPALCSLMDNGVAIKVGLLLSAFSHCTRSGNNYKSSQRDKYKLF